MKTAVEWLVNQMKQRESQGLTLSMYELEMFAEQANKMFEEQVTLSHINGQSEFDKGAYGEHTKKLATDYYNETFKTE